MYTNLVASSAMLEAQAHLHISHVKMRHGKTWAVGLFVCGERYRGSPIIDNNPAQGQVGVCITAGSLVGVPIIKAGFKVAAYIPEVGVCTTGLKLGGSSHLMTSSKT
jgi:hypothetical protein